MSSVSAAPDKDLVIAELTAQVAVLTAQAAQLKQQLDWFKRQLFGEKSEKRLEIQAQVQADLLAALEVPAAAIPPPPLETIPYTRRAKQRGADTVTDSGLRFDASVPVETIRLPDPADIPEPLREVIGESVWPQPGSDSMSLPGKPNAPTVWRSGPAAMSCSGTCVPSSSAATTTRSTAPRHPPQCWNPASPTSACWPGCWSTSLPTIFRCTASISAWRMPASRSAAAA